MRNIEVVELLLDKGAKVSAVDKVQLCRGSSGRLRTACRADGLETGSDFILGGGRCLAVGF